MAKIPRNRQKRGNLQGPLIGREACKKGRARKAVLQGFSASLIDHRGHCRAVWGTASGDLQRL